MNSEDLQVVNEEINDSLAIAVLNKPRKNLKKMEQKYINLVTKPVRLHAPLFSMPQINFNRGQGIQKIGISGQQITSIEKYSVSGSKVPKLSNMFTSLLEIGAKLEEEAKNKAKSFSKASTYRYKKFETQQQLMTRYSLIDRSKNCKVYSGEAYDSFQDIIDTHNFQDKKLKLVSTYKGMSNPDIEAMDKRAIENCYQRSIDQTPKIHRYFQKLETEKNSKKLAGYCVKFHQKRVSKTTRIAKDYTSRARKLNKEALQFWRKRDKELNELRKKQHKLEKDKRRKEEEKKEALLQQKKLAFLMKQSDIYAHFMAKKLGIHKNSDEKRRDEKIKELEKTVEIASDKVEIDEKAALENVTKMINQQRRKVEIYDKHLHSDPPKLKKVPTKGSNRGKVEEEGEDQVMMQVEPKDKITMEELQGDYQPFDFSNVAIDNNSNLVNTPDSFNGKLKEYQLKGLRWLDNLFDQGINGILADEMGLGKTIQAIAMLAHLSKAQDNWGPFLVVAPNSTLYNWRNELNKFAPSLNVIPYWGSNNNRKIIRKFFVQSKLGKRESKMHVTITSYNLAVIDSKSFHRVRWQYIILDEAQAIKNNTSQRWKTLLGFKSRNKLLLTGTPIQNSMSELWALLHFIMPDLFDSLDQFKEWFSKDIESNSEDRRKLNIIQLNRLHAILKPFMLRRVKKDVEKEIGKKTEHKILCKMTSRQHEFYMSLKNKLSLNQFFEMVENNRNLLNLVMQLRKVCNHPELFERRQFSASYIFHESKKRAKGIRSQSHLQVMYANWVNPIKFKLPTLVFHEIYQFGYESDPKHDFLSKGYIHNSDYTWNDVYNRDSEDLDAPQKSCFSFLYLLGMSGSSYEKTMKEHQLLTQLTIYHANRFYGRKSYLEHINSLIEGTKTNNERPWELLKISSCFKYYGFKNDRFKLGAPKSTNKLRNSLITFRLPELRVYMPRVVSCPIQVCCSDTGFTNLSWRIQSSPLNSYLLYGSNKYYPYYQWLPTSKIKESMYSRVTRYRENKHFKGLLRDSKNDLMVKIKAPSFNTMIADSAKLKYLDKLLIRLKEEGHRVLIFCQMTKMLNILEEYLLRRNYTYFRLDGNTDISDRDQMVQEYQTNPNIFAFILSTRAGGLGVTLTAADTVIFYDNDWNPTMDAQATDRAHRIGQTKDVNVYRLVTKNTIEERILKRAQQKKNVQQTVYSGEAFKADTFKPSEVSILS